MHIHILGDTLSIVNKISDFLARLLPLVVFLQLKLFYLIKFLYG